MTLHGWLQFGVVSGPGPISGTVSALLEEKSLDGLSRDLGDEIEVLVNVQHREVGELASGRQQQIRHRRRAMLTAVGQQPCTAIARSSMAGVRYSTGIADSGGCRRLARRSCADRTE